MGIVFEPNPVKEVLNLRDHGVSFAAAQEVFDDPNHVEAENYFIDGEQRYQVIGMSKSLTLLLVVFVDHSNADTIVIRIISARKAEKFEEKIYAAHLTNQNY